MDGIAPLCWPIWKKNPDELEGTGLAKWLTDAPLTPRSNRNSPRKKFAEFEGRRPYRQERFVASPIMANPPPVAMF